MRTADAQLEMIRPAVCRPPFSSSLVPGVTETMNPTTNANGQRKSLASQIDRLDALLDGLADGLNDAVAQAVQVAVALAVKEAVQAVLTEVLTNPAVLAKLQAATPAASPEQPAETPPKGPGRLAAWRNWAGAQLKKAGECCRAGWERVRDAGVALARRAARVVTTAATAVREEAARVVATGWLLGNVLLRLAAAFGSGVAVRVALIVTGIIVTSSPGDLWALLLAALAWVVAWLRRLLEMLPWWVTRRPAWQGA
jgi:hypothetical protein